MKLVFIFLAFSFILLQSSAQRHTISGYITDKASRERLINANVYESNTLQGTTANNYGFYSISLPKGKVTITSSFIGYQPVDFEIDLKENITLNIELEQQTDELSEVIVTGTRNKVDDTQMSMIDIPIQKLQKIPVILGEADVLKVLQLLPGVQSGTEGTSGIYVRGGGPDQNLFLLDGVPVYNAGHLLGFFSVFNPDAIRTVKLYKGGFPARFGGRLSSVVDISMKDGNMQELKGDFSIGLISSKLMLEGPIVKDKTSFMISARRTYVDVLAQPLIAYINKLENDDVKMGAYFHDLNAKVNHIFSERSRLYLSFYHGKDKGYGGDTYSNARWIEDGDKMEWEEKFGLSWGNTISSARWNYLLTPKLFSNTTFTYSRYLFDIEAHDLSRNLSQKTFSEEYFRYYSGIEDLAAKIDFDYFPSPRHDVKFGANYINHRFNPGVTNLKLTNTYFSANTDTLFGNKNVYANELSVYVEDDISISIALKANVGIYLSTFLVDGKTFICPQPRFSMRYKAGNNWSLKASYSRMAQHLHLLSMSGIDLPTDLWVPVTKRFEPPISDQFALGSAINIKNGYTVTVEGFYKNMNNLIEYKDGASFIGNNSNWEDKVEAGRGWSYGLELLLEKTLGNTTGWIGYTWSKSERQFETINFGRVYPAKYDRRHDFSIVLTHKFSKRFDIGGTWVYGTGNTATLSFGKYPSYHIPYYDSYWQSDIKIYESRNNYRLPAYHRLDLGMNFHKEKKRGTRTWNISAYNAYNRKNPFMLLWKTDWNDRAVEGDYNTAKTKLYQLSLFPIIPSVSYSYKF